MCVCVCVCTTTLNSTLISLLSQVVPFNKLKTHYKTFEQRRQLASMYDLFLVDKRISHLIIDRLGKSFVQKKNHPYPVDLRKGDLVKEIETAISSTYLRLSRGGSFTVRIGRVSMSSQQVVDNIVAGMAGVVKRVPRGWSNVQSINIKTVASVALPIFNSLPPLPTLLPAVEVKQQHRSVRLERVKEVDELAAFELPEAVRADKTPPRTPQSGSVKTRPSVGKYSVKRVRGSKVLSSSRAKKRRSL